MIIMPLKLAPPTAAHPFYRIIGRWRGVRIRRSTGAAGLREAKAAIRRIREQIECGEYPPGAASPAAPIAQPPAPDRAPAAACLFVDATRAYIQAGGERTYLSVIIELTGPHALRDRAVETIDQLMIDNAAAALYPNVSAATRNRQFYTPVAAILHHAGNPLRVKRPHGHDAKRTQSWLEPEQATAVIKAADKLDAEFGLFLRLLLYTGARLSEALRIRLADLNLGEAMVFLPRTKNGTPRMLHLPPHLVAAFASQPPRQALTEARPGISGKSPQDAGISFLERDPQAKLFRWHKGGRLAALLKKALGDARLTFPRRERGFHLFRHTYATWMHRYAGLDAEALARAGGWQSARSTDRYRHSRASEEARRADLLPVVAGDKAAAILIAASADGTT